MVQSAAAGAFRDAVSSGFSLRLITSPAPHRLRQNDGSEGVRSKDQLWHPVLLLL